MASSAPIPGKAPPREVQLLAIDAENELQRLLSPDFRASARRKALLAYLVKETLQGRGDRLKEYSIAVGVFGRDETFDPRTDPVVRLDAHRLRHDLDQYYQDAGRNDPIRITIPKGGYVATFEAQGHAPDQERDQAEAPPASVPDSTPAPRRRFERFWPLLLAGCAIVALVLVLIFEPGRSINWSAPPDGLTRSINVSEPIRRGPTIALLPFQNASADSQGAYFGEGLIEQLISDLVRFDNLRVVSPAGVKAYDDGTNTIKNLRTRLGVDFVLRGSWARLEDKVRLALELLETNTDQVIWADTFFLKLAPKELFDGQADISKKLAAMIGSHYGAITTSVVSQANTQLPAQLSSYECVLQYYALVRSLSASRHLQVRSCLEQTVKEEPGYATAWALLANVYAQEYRFGFNPRPAEDPLERSFEAARRAVTLEWQNPTAQLMLALSAFDRHDIDGFRRGGALAVELNPNDPEILGQYGVRLAYIGDWDRGEMLVKQAINLNPAHPIWYYEPIAFILYQKGSYKEALDVVDRYSYTNPNFIWYQVFRAMTLGQLGRVEDAAPSVQAALRLRPDIRRDFWQMARVWNIPENQIAQMALGLRKAGLEVVFPEDAPKASKP